MEIREGRLDKILAKGKYHSAIATTYNFDPVFINHVFIPILNSKRIRNTTILTDPREFEKTFSNPENLVGLAESSNLIIPADTSSLFHPKLMLFVGKKEGLCLIGSGNLTHSGMGGNSEIWGAFHTTNEKRENAHIFKSAWSFLRDYIPELTESVDAKSREWCLNNAPWFKDIVQNYTEEEGITKTLINSSESTIWETVRKRIKDKSVDYITILSPFYDKKGYLLKELSGLFPDARINMIYDEQGTIPLELTGLEHVNCYRWQDLVEGDNNEGRKRLHAKLILIADKNGGNHLVFGSANATNAGMGIKGGGFKTNIEFSVLASGSTKELEDSLGISLDGIKPANIEQIEVADNALEEPFDQNRGAGLKLLYAEQNNEIVILVFNKLFNLDSINISLFDGSGNEIDYLDKERIKNNSVKILIGSENSDSKNIPTAFLAKVDGNDAKVPVFSYNQISLDNPDTRSELLRNTLSDIGNVDFGALYENFMDIFNEVGKQEKEKIKRGGVEGDSSSNDDENEEEFYSEDELEKKSQSQGRITESSFIVNGVLALMSALNKRLLEDEDIEPNYEALSTDSSEEVQEQDEEGQDSQEEKIPKVERVYGYRRYFKKTVRYYDKFIERFDEDSQNAIIDKKFISHWLLVSTIAVHVIYSDLNSELNRQEGGSNNTITFLPSGNSSYMTIEGLYKHLLENVIRQIIKSDRSMSEYLDLEQRIEGAGNVLILLHLKHWKSSRKDYFKTYCQTVLDLFDIESHKEVSKFNTFFTKQASKFMSSEVRQNNWWYYNNFRSNFELFESHS